MRLELRARHVKSDPRLRALCERHLRSALGRFDDQLRRVQLWIEDVNGPRGGRDLRCRVRLCLRRGGALTVEGLDARPEVVVGEVLDRARNALVRQLQRRRWAPMRRTFRPVFG